LPSPGQSTTVRETIWRSLAKALCCGQRFKAALPQSKPSN
jgi:hypothetical protein